MNDEKKAGRPSTFTTDNNIGQVHFLILNNPHVAIKEEENQMHISYGYEKEGIGSYAYVACCSTVNL